MSRISARDAFTAKCLEMDRLLAEMQALRADHFGADPEAIHWGHVGSAGYVVERLREAVSFAKGQG